MIHSALYPFACKHWRRISLVCFELAESSIRRRLKIDRKQRRKAAAAARTAVPSALFSLFFLLLPLQKMSDDRDGYKDRHGKKRNHHCLSLSLSVGETRCGLILFTMIFILRTHAQMFPGNVGTFHFDCHCRRSKAENQELCWNWCYRILPLSLSLGLNDVSKIAFRSRRMTSTLIWSRSRLSLPEREKARSTSRDLSDVNMSIVV